MSTSRTDDLLAILQNFFTPREEGWLWLAVFADDCEGGVVQQIEGEYDDAAATAQVLGRMITDTGVERAYLALCRREGRPKEADRELWRHARRLVSAEILIDMVVFNRHETWSMRAEDAEAASAAPA